MAVVLNSRSGRADTFVNRFSTISRIVDKKSREAALKALKDDIRNANLTSDEMHDIATLIDADTDLVHHIRIIPELRDLHRQLSEAPSTNTSSVRGITNSMNQQGNTSTETPATPTTEPTENAPTPPSEEETPERVPVTEQSSKAEDVTTEGPAETETATPSTPTENGQKPPINYLVANNGVPYYPNDNNVLQGPYDSVKDYSYATDAEGNRTIINRPKEDTPKKSTSSVRDIARQMDQAYVTADNGVPYYGTTKTGIDQPYQSVRNLSKAYENGEERALPNPPASEPQSAMRLPDSTYEDYMTGRRQAGDRGLNLNRDANYKYSEAAATGNTSAEPSTDSDIQPVDSGYVQYLRNSGWGSNSAILGQMGYSQDKIRRMLDASGAIRPEFFRR